MRNSSAAPCSWFVRFSFFAALSRQEVLHPVNIFHSELILLISIELHLVSLWCFSHNYRYHQVFFIRQYHTQFISI